MSYRFLKGFSSGSIFGFRGQTVLVALSMLGTFAVQGGQARAASAPVDFTCSSKVACLTWVTATGYQDQTQEKADEAKGEKSASEDGTEDFEKATELKVSAKQLRDLDKVVQLCESALEKGLDKDSEKFCRKMLLDTLMEYSRQMSTRILVPNRDGRWQFLRRESLKRLEQAVKIDDKLVEAWILIAKLNVLENGDRTQGMEAIDKVIDLAADDKRQLSEALLVRAGYAENDEDRLEDLNQAVEVDVQNVEALRTRGLYFYLKEENDKAISDFQKLVDLDKEDANSRLLLIEVFNRVDRFDDALKQLEDFPTKAGDIRPTLLKSQVYFSKKDYEKSLENAEVALKSDKDNLQAINLKILSLLQLERYEDASKEADDLVKRAPGLPQAYWLRSIALSSMDKFDEAITDLQLLVENVPDNPTFKLQLGNLYNASDRPRLALKLFDQLYEEDPEIEGILRSRGDAYLAIGKHKEAISDYEKELARDPEDSGTLNNLAWVLSTTPMDDLRDGKRAVELALKSCELTKYEQPHILSTLASSYAEAGDFDKARQWIEKALKRAEETKSKNLDDIKKELEFYKKDQPWRELEEKEDIPLKSGKDLKLGKDDKDKKSSDSDDDF